MNLNSTRIFLQLTLMHGKRFFRSFQEPRLKPTAFKTTSVQHYCSGKSDIDENDFEDFDTSESSNQEIDYEALTKGDPELLKKLKYYELEKDMMFKKGEKVPQSMTTEQWAKVLTISTPTQRHFFYRFVWLNQMKYENTKFRKEKRHQKYLEFLETKKNKDNEVITTSSPVNYGLSNVSLFHRIRDTHIDRFYNYKLLQAMIYGPQLIIDCGYEEYMTEYELNLCIKQLMLLFARNRSCTNPFDLLFCNLKETSPVSKKMKKLNPKIGEDPIFPFNSTEKHYLDLYSKDQLVYLTPHCNEILKNYDYSKTYIIGALVDKTHNEPLSLAKAKKEGLKVAKFPLDQHLDWGLGIKSLTLDQCVAIMNDVMNGHQWQHAFRHVPRRKLREFIPITLRRAEYRKKKKELCLNNENGSQKSKNDSIYDLILNKKK